MIKASSARLDSIFVFRRRAGKYKFLINIIFVVGLINFLAFVYEQLVIATSGVLGGSFAFGLAFVFSSFGIVSSFAMILGGLVSLCLGVLNTGRNVAIFYYVLGILMVVGSLWYAFELAQTVS